MRIGQRSADAQRTYGYRRFEILAAAFNAVLLFVVAVVHLLLMLAPTAHHHPGVDDGASA